MLKSRTSSINLQPVSRFGIALAITAAIPFLSSGGVYSQNEPESAVAEVNGQPLRLSELTKRLLSDFGKRVLDQLINESIIAQEAERLGLKVSEEEVDAELKNYINKYPVGTSLDSSVAEQGLGPASLREQLRTVVRLKKMVVVEGEVPPRDKDIEERLQTYLRNPELLNNQDQYRVSVIYIKDKGKAEGVLRKLKEGADFAQTARSYSEEASAAFGGDVGWRNLSDMESFLESLKHFNVTDYKIEKGKMSDLVEAQDGCWIFKVVDFRAVKRLGEKEVRSRVREILVEEQFLGLMNKKLTQLRTEARIVRKPPYDQ